MHACVGAADKFGPIVDFMAQNICHFTIAVWGGRAQRPTGNRPDMLFELTHRAGICRDMARIVHARGNFIDNQTLGRVE